MCLSYAVSLPYPKNSLLAHVIPGRMSKATRSYGERGTPWVPWSDLCHDSIQWSSRVATKLSMSHVCMCVWNIWIDVKPLLKQGATGEHCSQRPTKTLQCSCENVPAIFQFFVNGNRLSQEPACRFQTIFKPNLVSGGNVLHLARTWKYKLRDSSLILWSCLHTFLSGLMECFCT